MAAEHQIDCLHKIKERGVANGGRLSNLRATSAPRHGDSASRIHGEIAANCLLCAGSLLHVHAGNLGNLFLEPIHATWCLRLPPERLGWIGAGQRGTYGKRSGAPPRVRVGALPRAPLLIQQRGIAKSRSTRTERAGTKALGVLRYQSGGGRCILTDESENLPSIRTESRAVDPGANRGARA